MKVVYYLDSSSDFAGGQKSLIALLHHLDRSKFSPVVILDRRAGRMKEEIGARATVVEVDYCNWKYLEFAGIPLVIIRLLFLLRGREKGVLHGNTFKAGLICVFVSRALGWPFVFRSRLGIEVRSHGFVDRIICDGAHIVLANSVYVRNTYINRFGKEKCGHVKVLYNPLLGTYELDDAEVRNLRERHFREAIFTFGLVGRVEPFKRLEEAIKAAHALRSVRPKFRILIVGADSLREGSTYRNRLQAMITEFQLEECIFFTGFIASIHEMTVLLDCLILCTEGEALSRSVYEAQVLSVPVIASDSGGNPELIQDGESGLLYELGNPSDLSKKMQLMMDSEHLRNTLRRNAAHSVTERFSMATTVRKEEIYYLALLEGK